VLNTTENGPINITISQPASGTSGEWQTLSTTQVSSSGIIELEAQPLSTSVLHLTFSNARSGGGDFKIKNIKYQRKDVLVSNKVEQICSVDPDFSNDYRFGFNGKEKDNEIKGTGNSLDFGARIYDSRLGRWLSLDPLQAKYPSLSPYNYVGNSPLKNIEVDGRYYVSFIPCEPYHYSNPIYNHKNHGGRYWMVASAKLEIIDEDALKSINRLGALPVLGVVFDGAKLLLACKDNSINFDAGDWAGVAVSLIGIGVTKATKGVESIDYMWEGAGSAVALAPELVADFKQTDYFNLLIDKRTSEILKKEGVIDEDGNFSQKLIQKYHNEGIQKSNDKNSAFYKKQHSGFLNTTFRREGEGAGEMDPMIYTQQKITELVDKAKAQAVQEFDEATSKKKP
jgi:RHS repeat-associated protein